MKKYIVAFKMAIQANVEYRWNMFFDVAAQIIISLFIVLVWKYIAGGGQVGDFSQNELIAYLLFSGFILSSIHGFSSGDNVNNLIKDGELSFWIAKPWYVTLSFLADELASRWTFIVLSAIGYGALAIGFGVSFEGITLTGSLLALPIILIAFLLNFFMFHSLSFLAFWLDQTWGPRLLFRVVMDLGAGILIPISLIHPAFRKIILVLPFRFFGDVPALTAFERISGMEYLSLLGLGLGWVALWVGIFLFVWRQGTKSYEAVGQ